MKCHDCAHAALPGFCRCARCRSRHNAKNRTTARRVLERDREPVQVPLRARRIEEELFGHIQPVDRDLNHGMKLGAPEFVQLVADLCAGESTTASIAERFEISRRQVERIRAKLRANGVPVRAVSPDMAYAALGTSRTWTAQRGEP